jgi:hypothetical protein
MVKLPIPESALSGPTPSPSTGLGVNAGYVSPLAIPTAPLSPQPAPPAGGPSTQPSMYQLYPSKG